MNQRFLNINALLGCLFFLIGNIVYDWLDTPEDLANYRIFYIPFSYMVFALILLAKDYAQKQRRPIYIFWWFFMWLSIGQIVKFLLFNPFLQMISDYGFLGIAILGTIYKLYNANKK